MDNQARLRQISRELAKAKAKITRSKKRQKKERRTASKVWKITGNMRVIALAIYVITGGLLEPVMMFVRKAVRRYPTWPRKSDDDLKLIILDLVDAATDEDLMRAADHEHPLDVEALRTAQDSVVAWKTGDWARSQNSLGRPMGPADVLDHREEENSLVPAAARPRSWGAVTPRLASQVRKNVQNLRNQFGGYFGRMPLRPNVPQELLVAKATNRARVRTFGCLFRARG